MLYRLKNNGSLNSDYNQSLSKVVAAMNKLVGTSIHHDTITGTSPSYVITNETKTIENIERHNSIVL